MLNICMNIWLFTYFIVQYTMHVPQAVRMCAWLLIYLCVKVHM